MCVTLVSPSIRYVHIFIIIDQQKCNKNERKSGKMHVLFSQINFYDQFVKLIKHII